MERRRNRKKSTTGKNLAIPGNKGTKDGTTGTEGHTGTEAQEAVDYEYTKEVDVDNHGRADMKEEATLEMTKQSHWNQSTNEWGSGN